ncbi:MAG TPA: chemotaxis protein CheB [Gaiellaceae bacterium]|nr:chemotaxis protein CheB [Gaiellaceae bacterium]
MPDNDCSLVVVGASAGGVEALQRFVHALPGDFTAPVLIVLHASPTGRSYLPEILSRAGSLPAVHALDGAPLEPGHIYVAPPDSHLVIANGHMSLAKGPRENGHRPAIDPLFRTAADAYDSHVAGVVLSGTLDDGTVGLHCIKVAGGATLVQDPGDALYRDMPENAIAYVHPDYVQPVEELVETLVRLTASAPTNGRRPPMAPETLPDAAPAPAAEIAQPGEMVSFSCPDCGGTLWETQAGGTASYRCRVGHAYTLNNLLARQGDSVERALWTAYRALEERSAMSRRVARRLAERGREESAARFERQAETAERNAAELKDVLDAFEAAPQATD